MNNDELLGNKYRIRKYFIFGLSGLITFFFIRFFLIPYFTSSPWPVFLDIITLTLDNIIVASLVALSTTAFILFITPPSIQKTEVSVVEPGNLKNILEENLDPTTEFWYRGHTARWSRSVTFPQLAQSARKTKSTIKIYLIILNPNLKAVCESYANFQNKFGRSANDIKFLMHDIRLELLATIVSAYAWKNKEPLLDFSIGLWDKLSLFRVDFTNSAAIITKPDINEPALIFFAGTRFFMSYREDLQISYSQSQLLPKNVNGIEFNNLSIEQLKEFLTEIGINYEEFDNNDLSQIIEMSKSPENPYSI